jgi:uncharacterized protein
MIVPENNLRVDYLEWPVLSIAETKRFYSELFGWKFEDWGPDYISFHDGRMAGGFFKAETIQRGGALVVIACIDLEGMLQKVQGIGATITKDIFSFPGGRRFQFLDPSGHELALWTES